jgi:hypothetical protein
MSSEEVLGRFLNSMDSIARSIKKDQINQGQRNGKNLFSNINDAIRSSEHLFPDGLEEEIRLRLIFIYKVHSSGAGPERLTWIAKTELQAFSSIYQNIYRQPLNWDLIDTGNPARNAIWNQAIPRY